jgi:predicted  nucleic acid-binding Zn-ribbon protein
MSVQSLNDALQRQVDTEMKRIDDLDNALKAWDSNLTAAENAMTELENQIQTELRESGVDSLDAYIAAVEQEYAKARTGSESRDETDGLLSLDPFLSLHRLATKLQCDLSGLEKRVASHQQWIEDLQNRWSQRPKPEKSK